MTTTDLARPPQGLIDRSAIDRGAHGTEAALARVTRIQEIRNRVMKPGVHYGPPFPGADKPTLLKPGAELLLLTFQVAAIPEIEDLSTPDVARYRVRARGVHQGTGETLGEYTAEASSDEDKRRWRGAVCDEEWDEAPIDQRRKLWKKKGAGGDAYTVLQIRTSPADEANDVLAIAQKRAMVGLTRQVLACSDLFDQNLEDMPDYLREPAVDEQTGRPQRTSGAGASTSATKPSGDDKPKSGITDPLQIASVKKRELKKKAGGTTLKYEITAAGIVYETFFETLAKEAQAAHKAGGYVRLHWTLNEPYGRKLDKLEAAEAPAPATPPPAREREPEDENDEDLTPPASSMFDK